MAGSKKSGRVSAGVRKALTYGRPAFKAVTDPLFPITINPHLHLNAFYEKRAKGDNWLALMVRLKLGVEIDKLFSASEPVHFLVDAFRTMHMIEERFLKTNVWSANYVEIADISFGLRWVDSIQSMCSNETLAAGFRVAISEMAARDYYL